MKLSWYNRGNINMVESRSTLLQTLLPNSIYKCSVHINFFNIIKFIRAPLKHQNFENWSCNNHPKKNSVKEKGKIMVSLFSKFSFWYLYFQLLVDHYTFKTFILVHVQLKCDQVPICKILIQIYIFISRNLVSEV